MKRTILIILALCAAGITVVVVLFRLSNIAVHKHNPFVRQFPPHPVVALDTMDIEYDSYYIAGATTDKIYLGNTTNQTHLLEIGSALDERKVISLWTEEIGSTKFWALRIRIDSPYFFLADGAVPRIYTGTIGEWIPRRYEYDSVFFVDFEPAGYWTIALRSVSSATNEFELGRLSLELPHVRLAPELLQKQIDGRFCVDGMLHYNRSLDKLIYLHYYRNEFLVCDMDLNLAYRGKTIDTVSTAQLRIEPFSSTGFKTHAAPPLVVNKYSSTSGNSLFVNSGLMAKNEDPMVFDQHSVIDVYDIPTGEYRFSFYLPGFNGERTHDFQVVGDRVIVLIDRFVLTYKIATQYL